MKYRSGSIKYRSGKAINYQIVILLLLLGLSLVNMASAVSSNSKFDEDNNSLIIKSPAADKALLTIQQISVKPDLVTMEEIFKIIAHEDHTFQKNKDFSVRWQKYKGETNITGLKWEILEEVEYNVTAADYANVEKNKTISNILSYTNITDDADAYGITPERLGWGERHANLRWDLNTSNGSGLVGFDRYEVVSTDPLNIKFFWNVTEQIGRHSEAKYRYEWRPFLPNDKTIRKNESYTVRLTLYKEAQTGDFSIKTIPMFAGIEEDRFTWWNGSWNYYTDNPIPNSARPYQLPLNISNSTGTNNATHVFLNGHASNNFTDIRFTLDNTTLLPYWIEDNSTGRAWVNVTANGTVNLYYSNPSAVDSRDGNSTFEFFDDFTNNRFGRNPVISPIQAWESGTGDKNRWGSIALVNDTYYIYFTNNTNGFAAIGRATSTDLINWTKYANNPVIKNAIGPSLLKELNGTTPVLYNGKYWMATMAYDGSGVQIRSAANIDSDTWVVENSAALVPKTGTWYSSQVFTNSFVREGSTYYLVFQGDDGTYWRIGYATASAPGGPYTVQGILLESTQAWEGNAVIDPEVRKFGSTYYLFYTGGVPPVPYNNSYATSTSLTGSYTKTQIQLTPLQHTYPAILEKDSFYYILDDDQTTTGKGLYKRANLNGGFGSPFMWDSEGSPTVSGSELLLNAEREYIRSGQTFLYKAMKVRAKYAPLTADNSYQYLGFAASNLGGDLNSVKFESNETDFSAISGDLTNWGSTSVYNANYFDSYRNYEILWREGEAKFLVDDVLRATRSTYIPDIPLPVGIYDFNTVADFYADWVFVRNYVSPEPAWAPWTQEQTLTAGNEPNITSWGNSKTNNNSSTLIINTSETVNFNATADQVITTWNWYKDGGNQNNNFNNLTTSWDTAGTKIITVNAINSNGTSNTITWNITVNAKPGVPGVVSYDPSAMVSDYTGATRTFTVAWNQTVNAVWYINGSQVEVDNSAMTASYTNTSAAEGTWNITVTGTNSYGTASQTWIWTVKTKGTWYDQNWQYRKAIEIYNTGDNLIDYQTGLTIDTRSLVSAGKLNSDGSDLRFTESDGITPLPFWNETAFNLTNTTIWVKVPSVTNPANTTVYMYYGYPPAGSTADGDATFEFFENNFLMPLDNNATSLNTPTYDGSGEAVHPDVYYNASGWNGYKYWMVMTPYPNGGNAALENPSVLTSNDGFSWVVPAGLINPIDPEPPSGGNSDVEIVYNEASNRLEVYYVESGAGTSYLKRRTSTDGISWSNEEDIFNLPDYQVMSPAIIKDGSTYDMWYDNANSCSASTAYVEYRTSQDGITWSGPQNVNINQPGLNIWHVDVIYVPSRNEYLMVFAAYPSGSTCGNTDLYFAKSTDKINWVTYGDKIIRRGTSWDSVQIYRSTFLYNDTTDMLRVWYSARGAGDAWHIGYTERQYPYFAEGLRWSRSYNTGSSTANPRDGIYGLRQAGGAGAPPEHKLWQRNNSRGSYSYNIWYKDELSTVPSYLAALTLKHGATFSNIGVSTGTSTANYTAAISGSYSDTRIARTAGWHRLEIRVNNSGIYYYVDGKNAGSAASVTSSTNITPGINGYSAGTAFYDDYYIRKYTFPEPTYISREEETPFSQSPAITGFAPPSPVGNTEGDSRVFNITANQIVNVTWYINGTEVFNQTDVIESTYANTSASPGTWNVSAVAQNANGSTMQTWIWSVSGAIAAPVIFFTEPTPADNATLARNYAYINTTVLDTSNTTAFIDWNLSLAGWWRFNNESGENSAFFKDWSTWENDGTCTGTGVDCPISTSGKFGDALNFNGLTDYINAGFMASDSSGTMEAWIKPNNYIKDQYVMGGASSDGADFNARFDIFVRNGGNCPSGDWGTIIANGITAQTVCSGQVYNSINFPPGVWKHIAVTYNGSAVNVFTDGILVKTVEQTVSGAGNAQPFSIGRVGAYPGLYFDGSIDEVRIHKRALSTEEIKASYNAGIHRLYGNFTDLAEGVYDYKAYAQNTLGYVNLTETRTLTLAATSVLASITVFAQGADNSLWYREWNGASWDSWQSLGGFIYGFDAKSDYIAVHGADNGVWYRKRTGVSWSDWQSLGGSVVTRPLIVPSGSNIYIFARGKDNGVWTRKWDGSAWSDWQGLGGSISSDISATASGSEISIFARGADNGVWTRNWNGADWSDWQGLGGNVASDISATASGSEISIFARGADNGVWTRNWNGAVWSDWQGLGGNVASDISATSSDSEISIFARGADNGVWTRNWNGTAWSDWQGLGGNVASDISATASGSEISIFARGADNGVWTRNWNGTAWSDWQGLGGSIISEPVVTSG